MNTQALKDMMSKLNAKDARDVLNKVLDHIDGVEDGKFDPATLKAKVSSEVSLAAAKVVVNPVRTIVTSAVVAFIAFWVGFAVHAIYFH